MTLTTNDLNWNGSEWEAKIYQWTDEGKWEVATQKFDTRWEAHKWAMEEIDARTVYAKG